MRQPPKNSPCLPSCVLLGLRPAVTQCQLTVFAFPVSPSISLRKEGANESSLRRKRVAAKKQTRWVAFNGEEGREIKGGGREIKGGGTRVGGKAERKDGNLERRDFRRCCIAFKGIISLKWTFHLFSTMWSFTDVKKRSARTELRLIYSYQFIYPLFYQEKSP